MNWNKLNAAQREEFVKLFEQVLEKAYADRILSYTNEKIEYTRNQRSPQHGGGQDESDHRIEGNPDYLQSHPEGRRLEGIRRYHRECEPGAELPHPV